MFRISPDERLDPGTSHVSGELFRLLPEGLDPLDVVDDVEFTDVTNHGEIYTLYRIVRITHEATGEPDKWTHMANVSRVRDPGLGVAFLRVIDRIIVDSKVTLSNPGQ